MPIGGLTDRVTLKRRIDSAESEGGIGTAYLTVGTVWARVRSLSARAMLAADARTQEISHAVVLRRRNDLKPGDRLSWRGLDLTIRRIAPLDVDRAYIVCACSELAVTG